MALTLASLRSSGHSPGPASSPRSRRGKRRRLIGLVPLGALAVCLSACGTSRHSIAAVFPVPGSQVASPQTQIVFRGLPIGQLGRVTVTGSVSGRHSGRLVSDSDHNGGSFIPARPFAPGEVVRVRTLAPLLAAAKPSHRKTLVTRMFSFRVATPAGPIPKMGIPLAPRLAGDVMSFKSRPDLAPAMVEITKPAPTPDGGDVFITPQGGPMQNGPMIVDPAGSLVWFKPLPKGVFASDFRVQPYRGRPMLTWWQGSIGPGVGAGEDVIYDSHYRQVATVRAGNGQQADLHEFQLTPDGNALITAYYPVWWDASSVHGPKRAPVLDSVVQEVDVKTGLVLFQWDSLDRVPLGDSYAKFPTIPKQPYDYFHVNSVQRDSHGDLIISARNTWAAYKVDIDSGRVLWTLGGKRSSFRLPSGASFAFQHHVRVRGRGDGVVTVFDDGAGPPSVHQQSRGLTLALDPARGAAQLIRIDRHSPPLLAEFEGNVQDLPDGDQFLGWGQQPYFTEFDPAGQIVFDGRFVDANSSYRAFRYPWRGTPTTRPSIAATGTTRQTTVYASWNGATPVASWQVLTGPTPTQLTPAGTFPAQGFETQMEVPAAPYVAARALGPGGRSLATSPAVQPG